MRKSMECFVTGVAVYLLVAACSSTAANLEEVLDGSAGSTASAGSSSVAGQGAGGQSEDSGGKPSILDPVAGAKAAGGSPGADCECEAVAPLVIEADCNVFHDANNSYWAVIPRPDLPESSIHRVTAVATYPTELATEYPASYIAGYSQQLLTPAMFSPTHVAVQCGSQNGVDWVADRVTFTFPR